MAYTDLPAFNSGDILTAARMNQMRVNGRIGHLICTSANRPAAPDAGTMIYETDTTLTLVWNGSAWQQTRKNTDTVATSLLSGSVPAANMPTGSVIQVVFASASAQVTSTTLLSWISWGISAVITPRSTASRVLIQTSLHAYMLLSGPVTYVNIPVRIMRNGVQIYSAASSVGALNFNTAPTVSQGLGGFIPLQFVDTPSTTSATTYTFESQLPNTAGTLFLNYSSGGTTTSTVVLTEIAAA